MSDTPWLAIIPADRMRELRGDERLAMLLALARVVNALSLARGPIQHPLEDPTAGAHRERMSAMLYTAALLHEGMIVAQSLGKHFRHLPQYHAGLGKLLSDVSVRKLRTEFLDPMRDKFVFHSDRHEMGDVLKAIPDGDYVFAMATSSRAGDIYYCLADDAARWAVTGEMHLAGNTERFFLEVAKLWGDFLEASHRLIAAAAVELRFARTAWDPSEPVGHRIGERAP